MVGAPIALLPFDEAILFRAGCLPRVWQESCDGCHREGYEDVEAAMPCCQLGQLRPMATLRFELSFGFLSVVSLLQEPRNQATWHVIVSKAGVRAGCTSLPCECRALCQSPGERWWRKEEKEIEEEEGRQATGPGNVGH